MVFSSMLFMWVYLPLMLLGYYITGRKYKNIFLVLGSLFFYAWGEPIYIFLMLVSICFNWKMGMWIESGSGTKKSFLIIDLIVNIGVLIIFKYLDMLVSTINTVLRYDRFPLAELVLPIGISFYTFQVMSYIIDLYRGKYIAQRNMISLALYISFFPQLIAGPIVRYADINEQIENRTTNMEQLAVGIRRFIYGLGKKVILANTLAESAELIAEMNMVRITGVFAWIGAILYTLQIYYDFSGYSDMAIGIGKMFGFHFSENFDYPYLSKSISEFWRRWHISLGTWFKEYLYIPLGGNRKGNLRTYFNLLIVFAVTGLWHGASWNFVLWGIYYGLLIVLERMGLGQILVKHKLLARCYSMLVIVFGWVIFQQTDIVRCTAYIIRMLFPWKYTESIYTVKELVSSRMLLAVVAGLLGCGAVQYWSKKWKLADKWKNSLPEMVFCIGIVVYSFMSLAGNSYNPFIYFRF